MSTTYTKGFNDGYLIAKHDTDLSDQITSIQGTGDYVEGIRDGHIEASQERDRDQLEHLRELRERGKGRGRDR